jgi:tetratricopeptide (TPR) repeat protein
MKRAAFILGILILAVATEALSFGQAAQQTPPAGQGAPATQNAPAQGAPTGPAAKRPPQAKTQPEFDAWKAADASPDAASLEKASDDFASKFPDSELRVLLYKKAMRMYQNANNGEKVEAMGRKVLALEGDDPEALVSVTEVIVDRTHESDLDKDQRYDEGMKMAQKALQTVDTDVTVPAGATQQQVDAYKASLRSRAYSAMGSIEYNRNNFPAAQADFQKAIDAVPNEPYSLDVLHLALALDKQQKYPEALKVANRVVDMTKENDQIGALARRERDRLQQLTGGVAPAQPQSQPPKN